MEVLGYGKWGNFKNVIEKSKETCRNSNFEVLDHFADVGKMVDIASDAQRKREDYKLTRYACYLIAQNGSPQKKANCFITNILCNSNKKTCLG